MRPAPGSTASAAGPRRAARAALLAAGLLTSLAAPPAAATEGLLPRHSVAFSAGPYRPRLSSHAEERAAFDLVFDQNKGWLGRHPLAFSAQYGRYLSQAAGLLGVYGRLGLWRQSGAARVCRDAEGVEVECTPGTFFASEPGGDRARLTAVPVGVGVLYRADQLRRANLLPLTFAAQAGLDYHLWWASLGTSRSHLPDGRPARGGVMGLSGSLQVALALDGLRRGAPPYGSDRSRAATYLFVEGRLTVAPGLGQRGRRLDFSDLGELRVGLAVETF